MSCLEQDPSPLDTHQSHSPEDRDSVDALHGEIDKGGDDDDEIEDIPPTGEIVLAKRGQLQNCFQSEERCENLPKRTRLELTHVIQLVVT